MMRSAGAAARRSLRRSSAVQQQQASFATDSGSSAPLTKAQQQAAKHQQHAQKQYPSKPLGQTRNAGSGINAQAGSVGGSVAAAGTPVAPAASTSRVVTAPTPHVTPLPAVSVVDVVTAEEDRVDAATAAATPASAAAPVTPAAAQPGGAGSSGGGGGSAGGNGSYGSSGAGARADGSSSGGGSRPPPKKGRLLRTIVALAGLLVLETGVVLAALRYSVDLRDYADVHLPQEMARLREELPGFLPELSRRAAIGRVAKPLGLVNTFQEDVDQVTAALDAKVETTLEPVVDVVGSKVVPLLNGQTPLQTKAEAEEQQREVAVKVKEEQLRAAAEKARQASKHAPAVVSAPSEPLPVITLPAPVLEAAHTVAAAVEDAASSAAGYALSLIPSAPLDPEAAEFQRLQKQLADAEAELASFTADQQKELWAAIADAETALKARTARRLASLEAHQRSTLESLAKRQEQRYMRAHERETGPKREEFVRRLNVEEENKWRRKLYDAMLAQNDAMSEVADHALVRTEDELRMHYATEVARLERAAADTEKDLIRPLEDRLAAHRHQELRSAQAHRLSAALLSLQELTQRDRVSLADPWRVVRDIAQTDYTLRQAVSEVDELSVTEGVYSLHSLKHTFAQLLAPQLKVATFLPDDPSTSSVLRLVAARLFSALTLTEAGGVVLASPSAADVLRAAPSLAAARRETEAVHQAADYAHYVNASTFLASNAPELALKELQALHPSRRAAAGGQLDVFIRELERTVRVAKAVGVVKMRVLALNHTLNQQMQQGAQNGVAKA